MKLNLNIGQFMRRMLPAHMIQPNRLELYWWILREIDYVWDKFTNFRKIKEIEQNITFSLQSLEWWLNFSVFSKGETKLSIKLSAGNPYFMLLSNKGDEDEYFTRLSETDGTYSETLARKEDEFGDISTDFAIISDVSLTDKQKEQINLITERYRSAGTNYQIIES